jgi:excisionase family DNA binding protein
MTEIPDKPYFTASEVARLMLVSANSVRVWTNKGLLKTEMTLGGHRRFPRREIERLVHEREWNSIQAMPGALRILIIDDDEVFSEVLAQGLSMALPKAAVSLARDGFTGGMLARGTTPDIILLDLRMPGLDGFQICKMLKADVVTSHIRVIAISGNSSETDRQNILEAGAEELLAKPVNVAELLKAINVPQ